jgi:hypothetical protein
MVNEPKNSHEHDDLVSADEGAVVRVTPANDLLQVSREQLSTGKQLAKNALVPAINTGTTIATQGAIRPIEGVPEASTVYLNDLTAQFQTMYARLSDFGMEIPEIREALNRACKGHKSAMEIIGIKPEVADEALEPILRRIDEDESKARGGVLSATKIVRGYQKDIETSVSSMVDRLTTLGVLKGKNEQIAEFANMHPRGNELISAVLIASQINGGNNGGQQFTDRHQELMAAFNAYADRKQLDPAVDRKDAALWELAKQLLSEGFLRMFNSRTTPISAEGLVGALGERYVGTTEVREFVDTHGGMKGVQQEVQSGKYTNVHFLSTVTGKENFLTWYPKNSPMRPNEATDANIQKIDATLDKADMLVVYETDKVMKWLNDLPGNAAVDVHTKIPVGGKWLDADVTIQGHDLDSFTVVIHSVEGKDVSTIKKMVNGIERDVYVDQHKKEVDPNFTGTFNAQARIKEERADCVINHLGEEIRDAKAIAALRKIDTDGRVEMTKNCVLELLARSGGQFQVRRSAPATKTIEAKNA